MRDRTSSIRTRFADRAAGTLRLSAALATLLVFVQAVLAGHLLTGHTTARDWHGALGTEVFLGVAAIQAFAASLVTYATRRTAPVLVALSLFGLITLQSNLGWDGRLALHVPNALIILTGQIWLLVAGHRQPTHPTDPSRRPTPVRHQEASRATRGELETAITRRAHAWNEIAILHEEGRRGSHLTGVGLLRLELTPSDRPWLHLRLALPSRATLESLERGGWEVAATWMAFTYFKRPAPQP